MVPISLRMRKIADMASALPVADIGCDHGFVSIYLVLEKGVSRAIAMDINEGPLMRAREHIREYDLTDRIDVRRSDGAKALEKGEVETAIIAGMGGRLTIKIIEDSFDKFSQMESLVLSPHSEVDQVRKYLFENGFVIIDEDMVYDEEKYYTIIKCSYQNDKNGVGKKDYPYGESGFIFGPKLIEKKHPILKEYLEYRLNKYRQIKENIIKKGYAKNTSSANRLTEIEDEIKMAGELITEWR